MSMLALRAGRRRAPLLVALLTLALAPVNLPVSLSLVATPTAQAQATFRYAVTTQADGDDGNSNDECARAVNEELSTGENCTLREAIREANSDGGTSLIEFRITETGTTDTSLGFPATYWTIVLDVNQGPLETLDENGTTINGYSQGQLENPFGPPIEIDGRNITDGTGLTIQSSNNEITGLAINRFGGSEAFGTGAGIKIAGTTSPSLTLANNNQIINNYLGTNPLGINPNPGGAGDTGNATAGLLLENASNTTARNNIIAGNKTYGVLLRTGASQNKLYGNRIGINRRGERQGNNQFGVAFAGGASNNDLGSTSLNDRNIISGNNGPGVILRDSGTTTNRIVNNFIGTNASAQITITDTGSISNTTAGILISNGASNNTIGGSGASSRNVISGNAGPGIILRNATTTSNTISANYVGLNVDGTLAIPNQGGGILIDAGASNNTIGGSTLGARNTISGNTGFGIAIRGSTAAVFVSGGSVLGNLIGLNSANTLLQNTQGGIQVGPFVSGLTIGNGTISGTNTIAGNGGPGIQLVGANINAVSILSNTIGRATLGNTSGISLTGGVSGTLINDNDIFDNNGSGLNLGGAVTNTLISNNRIGTRLDPAGSGAYVDLGNSGTGISATLGSGLQILSNTIGFNAGGGGIVLIATPSTTVTANRIGQNAGLGLSAIGAISPTIQGNDVFTNTFGALDLRGVQRGQISENVLRGNGGRGIWLRENGAAGTFGMRVLTNTIESNTGIAVAVDGAASVTNTILNNFMRLNAGTGGITLTNGANQNTQPPAISYVEFVDNSFRIVGNVNNTGGCGGLTCTVEIYDAFVSPQGVVDDEAFTRLVRQTVGPSGLFTVTLSAQPRRLQASTTTITGNTSAFADFEVRPGLQFTPSYSNPVAFLPGDVLSYTHRLTNTGTVSDSFTISRSSSQGWAVTPLPERVSLAPGQSITVTAVLTVPLGGRPGSIAGLVDVTTLTATQSLTTATAVSVTNRTGLGAAPRFRISQEPPQEVTAGDTARFRPTITNEGNLTATVTISATTNRPGWLTSFNPPSVTLAPGRSATIDVNVAVPNGTLAPFTGTLIITATPQISGTEPISTASEIRLVTTPGGTINPDQDERRGNAGSLVIFPARINYGGNGPAALRIITINENPAYTVTVVGTRVQPGGLINFTGPNDSAEFEVWVSLPRNAIQNTDEVVTIRLLRSDDEDVILDTAQYRVVVEQGAFPPIIWLPLILRR